MRGVRSSIAAVVLGLGCVVFAQSSARADVVTLRDGKKLTGTVKTQELGKYVVIELVNGTLKTVIWDDIKDVEISASPAASAKPPASAAPPVAPAAPPVAPAKPPQTVTTNADAHVGADGVSATASSDACSDGDTKCKEKLDVKIDKGGPNAKYEKTEDCATSDDEHCHKSTKADAGVGGINVSYSEKKVQRVHGQKSGAAQFIVSVDMGLGKAKNFELASYGLGLGLRLLSGGVFPGEKGGGWSGFFLDGTASLSLSQTKVQVPNCYSWGCSGTKEEKSSRGTMLVGATAGFQFTSFGALDPKKLTQESQGLALGLQVGRFIPFEGDSTFTWGPMIGYTKSEYNPGTAKYETLNGNLFILPTKDFFLVLFNVQAAFG